MKLTFLGAGSTIFVRNVIGDCMCSPVLKDSTFALYDISEQRLEESRVILENMKEVIIDTGFHFEEDVYLHVRD